MTIAQRVRIPLLFSQAYLSLWSRSFLCARLICWVRMRHTTVGDSVALVAVLLLFRSYTLSPYTRVRARPLTSRDESRQFVKTNLANGPSFKPYRVDATWKSTLHTIFCRANHYSNIWMLWALKQLLMMGLTIGSTNQFGPFSKDESPQKTRLFFDIHI